LARPRGVARTRPTQERAEVARMSSIGCPNSNALRAFATGMLADATFDQVAEHVEHCPSCEAALAPFDELTDEFLVQLRQCQLAAPAGGGAAPEPVLAAVRALALPSIHSRLDLQEPCQLGKFVLLEELGAGSFGHVFRARDAELGRIVAVKVPRAG